MIWECHILQNQLNKSVLLKFNFKDIIPDIKQKHTRKCRQSCMLTLPINQQKIHTRNCRYIKGCHLLWCYMKFPDECFPPQTQNWRVVLKTTKPRSRPSGGPLTFNRPHSHPKGWQRGRRGQFSVIRPGVTAGKLVCKSRETHGKESGWAARKRSQS